MRALALLLIAVSAVSAWAQSVSNPSSPTSNPNQINVTMTYLYQNKLHYTGAWSGTATYNSQDLAFYGGAAYVSLQAANLNNIPSSATAWWVAIPGGAMSYDGAWSGTATYPSQALVLYSGLAYISLQAANLNNNPATAGSWWVVLPGSSGAGGAGVTYCAATGGAGNALTCTPSPALGAYGAGVTISIKVDACNTGAETVNVSSLGTRNIFSAGAALAANALCPSTGTNQPFLLTDDGSRLNLLAGGGSSGGGGSGGGNGSLAPPTFTVPGGSYSSAQTISINGPGGATICYTLDGSNPTATTPGTCSHGSVYSSMLNFQASTVVNALATEATWSNSTIASATYTITYPVYSDAFARPDGSLGSNWEEPSGATSSLQIISGLVYATSVPTVHAFDVYAAGSFANNQWSQLTVSSGPGSTDRAITSISGQGIILRADPNGSGFYNDAVQTGPSLGGLGAYRIGNAASNDFCDGAQIGTDYAIGDTHMVAVAGTGPVFFWSLHGVGSTGQPTMDATCFDVANNIVGGEAGLGVLDGNSTPTLSTGLWQGGSLPSFSTTPTDNFQRANSGWLGVNWWFPEIGPTAPNGAFFRLANNSAVITPAGTRGIAEAIWVTPFTANQSSIVTVGSLQPADFLGALVRYNLPTNGNTFNDQTYACFDFGGSIDLFVFASGGQTSLATLGTFSGSVSTIELDATGTSSVSLVCKVNGTQIGSTYVDTTYALTGTYAGFFAYGSASSRVTGWTGAPI